MIALSMVPGLGPARIRALVTEFGSASAVFRASAGDLRRVRGIGSNTAQQIGLVEPSKFARDQLRRAANAGSRPVWPGQREYPPDLRQIFDPPPVLWARGRADVDFGNAIAIVGSRRPTERGCRFAHDLAFELTRRGWTIVSGLAYGIDASAHRGALDAGGKTAAVLGCGVDIVYPAAHHELYQRIMERGILLSEFAMGAKPDGTNFPRRNRVLSGICKGVVVVEAFDTGGGLITARFALDQNREVFAVPGPPYAATSAGCNRLIQSGEAKLILTVDDIEVEFGIGPPDAAADTVWKETPGGDDRSDPVLRCMSPDPMHVDSICEKSGISPAEVQSRLLLLEVSGRVIQLPGKWFYLAT
jgi:DNA processing protein